jgi:photosystem II stability/assembly factor-like uncharacterized protein
MKRIGYVLCLALSWAAAAGRAEVEGPVRDDPRGRQAARALEQGVRTSDDRLRILEIARSEARRWAISNLSAGPLQAARVPGNAWVNLGPRTANFEKNGVTYFKVDSGRPRTILVHPTNPDIVYLATSGGGVWKTFDATAAIDATNGPHWTPITETLGSLSIGALAMSPVNPDSLLVGLGDPFDVQVPGFFHSDDGGASWLGPVVLSGTYPGFAPLQASSVRDIAHDATGQVVLAATDVGLFRSAEGGVGTGWTLIDPDIGHAPQEFWSVGRVGGQVWIATSQDLTDPNLGGRVWRSIDDGISWGRITTITDVRRMTVAVSPGDVADPSRARVYILAENGAGTGQKDVFRSDDGGQTWGSLAVNSSRAPVNPNADQSDLDVMHGQAFYNQMIAVDPQNHDRVLVGGDLCLVRSLNGGVDWAVMADWLPQVVSMPDYTYVHADYHAGAISYASGSLVFYAGTDGGIFRSSDVFVASNGDAHFEDRMNRGIVSHLIYTVATAAERPNTTTCKVPAATADIVFGGFQDDGARLRVLPAAGDPTIFDQIAGGDGFGVGIGCAGGPSPGSDQAGSLLLESYVSQINRSTDGGGTFNPAMNGIGITLDPQFTFIMKIATDITDANGMTFLTPLTEAGTQVGHVFRTTNGAASWSSINGTINCADLRTGCNPTSSVFPLPLMNASTHPKAAGVYAAVSRSRAYVTTNGGASWDETVKVYPDASGACVQPSSIAFDPADTIGNTVWVSSKATRTSTVCSATTIPIPDTVGHLFKSTNAHALGSATWTAVHGSSATALPNVPINVVKVDPGDNQTLYVGTEIGLYRSIDGGATWARYGTGLPLVSVTELSIAADGSSVRIATYGRGFWEIYPKNGGSPNGVLGNGDFNYDQLIDGIDLVREAAVLLTTNADADYNAIGNLTGTTNSIDASDFAALAAKLGGRP